MMLKFRKFLKRQFAPDRRMLMLIFWPVFGVLFYLLEHMQGREYYEMWCPLDDIIPFCELGVIPYLYWFIFLFGMHVVTFFLDKDIFYKMTMFIIFTYMVGVAMFVIFPTCQNLRPEVMPRDNFLSRVMTWFYTTDSNTDVCPSLHVVGSMAVVTAAWNMDRFKTKAWRAFFLISGLAISFSTVFVKQHSFIDVCVGFAICVPAYLLVYKPISAKNKVTSAANAAAKTAISAAEKVDKSTRKHEDRQLKRS